MDLNNIQLSTHQLVQLYENTLVEGVPELTDPLENDGLIIRSLGGNAKHVLILVQKETEAFLPDGELQFLTTILGACGLSLADIALVNVAPLEQNNYNLLVEHFRSKQVVMFDITTGELGMPINFPPFQVQAFKDCRYLQAPALHLIEADVTLKKNLWAALKNIFGI